MRRFSITIAPAFITIRIKSSWPATNWKRAWRWSRAIRCCAPRPAISKCDWEILNAAIEILESVIADDPSMRIAVPTLAICYVQAGARERAAALLKDETLAAAEADSEMAYRLATYFAVEGDSSEALHWLRRAIYLGNENYPWFQKNPAWNNLRTNADFERILEDLKKGFRKNQKTWKRLLEQVPAGE